MSDEQKKIVPIDYTHREFNTIREDLLQLVKRFYPDTFRDWSEASFGALMVDSVAYIADQLSFYLDYNHQNLSFILFRHIYNILYSQILHCFKVILVISIKVLYSQILHCRFLEFSKILLTKFHFLNF